MANYQQHTLYLYGPATLLKPLFKAAQVSNPERLIPTAKPDTIPALSAHDTMRWHAQKDTLVAQLRTHLNRPHPYPVLDWEARCFLTNTEIQPALSLDADFDTTLKTTLSITALFFSMMPWLANRFTVTGDTGLPIDLFPATFLMRLPRNGSHIAKANLALLKDKAFLEIDFGWHRRQIPPSADGIHLLRGTDLPDTYVVDTLVDDSNFEPHYSAREPGRPLAQVNPHPNFKGPKIIDGMETVHAWDHWQDLATQNIPEPFLRCIFKATRDALKKDYAEKPTQS